MQKKIMISLVVPIVSYHIKRPSFQKSARIDDMQKVTRKHDDSQRLCDVFYVNVPVSERISVRADHACKQKSQSFLFTLVDIVVSQWPSLSESLMHEVNTVFVSSKSASVTNFNLNAAHSKADGVTILSPC